MRLGPLSAGALCLALVTAGCGGGGGDDASSESPKVPDGPPAKTAASIQSCIKRGSSLTALKGASHSADNPDDPAYELVITDGKGGPGGLIAVYGSEDEASRLAPSVKTNIANAKDKGGSGSVERHGAVTVVWLPDPPTDSTRDSVLGCLT